VIDAGEWVTRTCVVFINATTHPDPLCPTSVGSTLQQQGEGGGARGGELRVVVAVPSEHQCVPPRRCHPIHIAAPPQACPSCAPMRKSHRASVCTCMIHAKGRIKRCNKSVQPQCTARTSLWLATGGIADIGGIDRMGTPPRFPSRTCKTSQNVEDGPILRSPHTGRLGALADLVSRVPAQT
jgi:hypothetical protein